MDFCNILRYFVDMTPPAQCIRCGTCCKKGGPALHLQDQPLIENGRVAISLLFTIRQGEPAYDNVKNRLSRSPEDIVKIKGYSEACVFYEEKNSRCGIYRDRPLECRVLNCRDTKDMEALYAQNRISRRNILKGVEAIWEIVEDHQSRCDYEPTLAFVGNLKSSGKKDPVLEQKVLYALQYDLTIRKLLVEKGLVAPALIDFLLGRPMVDVVSALGFSMHRINGTIVFQPQAAFVHQPS